jgi:integrase
MTAALGLRIGETLGLRDVDFAARVIRIRQSVDSATRKIGGVKSRVSSADLPMSTQLEVRLRVHLAKSENKTELLFTNRQGRAVCAEKLRGKLLHPLLDKLKIPRGGFHSMRHGAATATPQRPAHHARSLRTRARRPTTQCSSEPLSAVVNSF